MMKIHKDLLCCCLDLTLLYLSLPIFNLISLAATSNDYVSSDKFLLNCGSPESSAFNGKDWTGDVGSSYLPSDYQTTSSLSNSIASNPSVPKIPYLSARIFHSQFTYTFPVTPGNKFIRLYFYSAPYYDSSLNPSDACFSVVIAGGFTLLDNFRPSATAYALKSDYFSKDFSINIKEKKLSIIFIPSLMASSALAFVNGIEIFSLPLNLYIPKGNASIRFIGQKDPFFNLDETAFEILYRVNVQHEWESSVSNIFGYWLDDSNYIFGPIPGLSVYTDIGYITSTYNFSNYTAPKELYNTARTMGSNDAINVNHNLTWIFSVDSGFNYFLRLHFCEISSQVTMVNQRVFKVYINNQIAENSIDLIALKGAPYVAMYRDYITKVSEKGEIRLDLHPNTDSKPKYADAILNGIEIMKLSNTNKSLAAHPQMINNTKKMNEKARTKKIINGIVVGSAILGFCLVSFIAFKLSRRFNLVSPTIHQSHTRNNTSASLLSWASSDHCRQFSLVEIKVATNNFDEDMVLGSGGFGKVYKGFIDDGITKVAIKRGNPKSHQGVREFQNEIELLAKFQHMHLKGYCQEGVEMILIYEYMAHGTLCDHLYKSRNPPLPWNLRLKICIGAARGLHYLHTGVKYSIIHRDVKTANILLNDEWVAKIADFGLSRIGPTRASCEHVYTEVKGTFGYLDPEYYKHRKLTDKSDVYSFGVVLFEVLCGRPAVKHVISIVDDEDQERTSLAEWALRCYQNGTIDRMIDHHLRGKIAPQCLTVFDDVAVKCMAETGSKRPSMSDVLSNLELALQLQEIDAVAMDCSSL
ncbi:receptor-like protein kinase FERONIA [Camellia sinensis]|uniref:Protein kinase domain-containing protein n=1 Tax=Camellia sinensis var. sinensis TaxID=542762 RepID=A0A4S4E097_CAMSN|nr:receptor-like protein kinase FERONIA [Camellia sinensis]THG08516.1 hypothetical protein TEA_002149 [Camellia sinensis var. sinensis]